jgi:hypothetical protein
MGLWQILLAAGWANVDYAVSVGQLNLSALPTPGCPLRGKELCVRWTIRATSWLQGCLGSQRMGDARSGPSNVGLQGLLKEMSSSERSSQGSDHSS